MQAIRIAAVTTLETSAQLADVQKAVALDPGNPIVHGRLAFLYGDSLDPSSLADAVREAQRASALDPNNPDLWLTLASACEAVRDHACADNAVRRALDLSPMVPQVWWTAANHYLRADQTGQALSCFHRLLES